jgi:hypothetical protein
MVSGRLDMYSCVGEDCTAALNALRCASSPIYADACDFEVSGRRPTG